MSLGLTGEEVYDVTGLEAATGALPRTLAVKATADDGTVTEFEVVLRIDTPKEAEYYRHGGILLYVLRQLRNA
jgi:aconitate hydratase